MSIDLSFDAEGVSKLKRFLNKDVWKGKLEERIKRATIKNAMLLVREVKKAINSREYKENSALTLALKKTNLPMTDQRNLWRAISYKLNDSFSAEVGIITDGESSFNKFGLNRNHTIKLTKLVELMESGYTIKVTPAMKKAIALAIEAKSDQKNSKGKVNAKAKKIAHNYRALYRKGNSGVKWNTGTSTYVVPPRKIFSTVWNKQEVKDMVMANWKAALEGAAESMGAKGGDEKYKG